MISEDDARRLGFIRYLYQLGVEQSFAPEPLSSASLLMFHDSAELFLELATEHLNSGANKLEFMKYFDAVEQELKTTLHQKETMRRMNKARVALKHHGTHPSKLDIEAFRVVTSNFFEENTPLIFGVAFADLSLALLVAYQPAQNALREADRLLATGAIGEALESISMAFAHLISVYDKDELSNFTLPYLRHLNREDFRGFTPDLRDYLEKIGRSVERIGQEVRMLRLGIDVRRYGAFSRIVPEAVVTMSGLVSALRMPVHNTMSKEQAAFCYAFVVESALKLQQRAGIPYDCPEIVPQIPNDD